MFWDFEKGRFCGGYAPRITAAEPAQGRRLSTIQLVMRVIRSGLSIDLLLVALIIRVCSSKFGFSEAVGWCVPPGHGPVHVTGQNPFQNIQKSSKNRSEIVPNHSRIGPETVKFAPWGLRSSGF